MYRIKALSVGYAVKELLTRPQALCVHSVFNRVINLASSTGQVISISSIHTPNFPTNIITQMDRGSSFLSFSLERGTPAQCSPECIIIGPVQLDLCNADLYLPALWGTLPCADKMQVSKLMSYTLLIAMAKPSNNGLSPLLQYITPEASSQGMAFSDPLCVTAWQVVQTLFRYGMQDFSDLAAPLIGLGPGLTPSGDDLVAGIMMAYHLGCKSSGQDYSKIQDIFLPILPLAKGTTLNSREMLRFAAHGQLTDAAENVALVILGQEGKNLVECVETLLSYGASSGVDQLVGILIGLRVALKI